MRDATGKIRNLVGREGHLIDAGMSRHFGKWQSGVPSALFTLNERLCYSFDPV
jgi:hypothetical protein